MAVLAASIVGIALGLEAGEIDSGFENSERPSLTTIPGLSKEKCEKEFGASEEEWVEEKGGGGVWE